jgi:hypothetical protein
LAGNRSLIPAGLAESAVCCFEHAGAMWRRTQPKRCRRSCLTLPPHSMHWLHMGGAGMECGGKGEARHTALAGNRSLIPSGLAESAVCCFEHAGAMWHRTQPKRCRRSCLTLPPHSMHLPPHGPRRYGVRWEGRSPPHRFGWRPGAIRMSSGSFFHGCPGRVADLYC